MLRIIKDQYHETTSKTFYHFDSMKEFLKQRGIQLAQLPSYGNIEELRKVNNNIKHRGIIDEKNSLIN